MHWLAVLNMAMKVRLKKSGTLLTGMIYTGLCKLKYDCDILGRKYVDSSERFCGILSFLC